MRSLLTDPNDTTGNANIFWGDSDIPKKKITGSDGSSMSSRFGLTPGQVNSQFDTDFSAAQSGYAPFPGDRSKMDQLQGVYEDVPDAFDVSETLRALGESRRSNLLTGEQAANTVASKFRESSIPGATSGVGASMLRAQALLPYLNESNAAVGKERGYADSAKQSALNTAAGIANQLVQLEKSYTDSLASYNSGKANFGLNYAGAKSSNAFRASENEQSGLALGLQAQRQAQQTTNETLARADAERQRQLAMQLQRKAEIPVFNGQMASLGRATPEYASYLQKTGQPYGSTGY